MSRASPRRDGRTGRRLAGLAAVGALIAACDSAGPAGPAAPTGPVADPVAGRVAFEAACAGCHASRDGFDLAFFGFADSTIVRRAVVHVDTATALDVVAFVRTLGVPAAGRGSAPFQPGGRVLGGDVEFARALFGEDAWPADLDAAALRSIDPRDVAVAVGMPDWSDEGSNLDWLPDAPLPDFVLDHDGGAPRRALAAYYANRSEAALLEVVGALRAATESLADPRAPCAWRGTSVRIAPACFEVRRWIGSLAGQHLLRSGPGPRPIPFEVREAWWGIGSIGATNPGEVENGAANRLRWLQLAWSVARGPRPSGALGDAWLAEGMPRHATFVALRSLVEREPGSVAAWSDLSGAARYLPVGWTEPGVGFGLRYLRAEVQAGRRPAPGAPRDVAARELDRALEAARPKLAREAFGRMTALGDELRAALFAP